MEIIDARDKPCPEPVVKTKNVLEAIAEGQINVLVNNIEACQNVQRFARSQGCEVKITENDGTFTIEITKRQKNSELNQRKNDVMLITSDRIGDGDESLGQLLMASFINTLDEINLKPSKIIFINRGVLLTTEGSRVLDTLQQLEKKGIQIFSCGTCLNHYQLKEKFKVGQVTNMYETVTSLVTAEKVIRI